MWDVAALGLKIKSDDFDVATERMGKFTKASSEVEAATNRLARVAGTAAGALAAAFSVRALVNYADTWSDMQSRVGAAVKDMNAAPELMKRLTDVANASYSPLQQTVETYARNVVVLRDLGYGAAQAADFTESLNHMLVITATRGERAASVQGALSKAMAVGKLQAEGLETVLANGGRVAEALAEELGTTTSGLRQMAAEGKITGDVIAKALLGSLEDVRAQAAEMPATITDGMTRIGTAVQAIVGTFDQAFGVSSSIATGLLAIGDGILSITDSGLIEWLQGLSGPLSTVGQLILVLAATRIPLLVTGLYSTAAAALAANGALLVAHASTALMVAQMYAGVIAARGFSAALWLAGGPAGALVGILAGIGFGIYNTIHAYEAWQEATGQTAEAQERLNSALEAFSSIKTLETVGNARDAAQATVDAIEAEIAAAEERLSTLQMLNPLWETDKQEQVAALISTLKGDLMGALAILDMTEIEWQRIQESTSAAAGAAATLTAEQQKGLLAANEMLLTSQRKAALAVAEQAYGRDSVAYKVLELQQERDIYWARVDSLEVSKDIKDAIMEAWWQEQEAAGKTQEWNAAMDILYGAGQDVLATVRSIAETEPGGSWLDTAIAKAGTLWEKLSGALGSLAALSQVEVDAVGNPVQDGVAGKRPKEKPVSIDFGIPGVGIGGASYGGGGGGGGGASPEQAFQDEMKRLKETTAALTTKAEAFEKVVRAGGAYEHALAVLEEKQRLLNEAQKAGVAITPELEAQVQTLAESYVTATEELQRLQEETRRGEDAMKNLFGAMLDGADAAKKAVGQLILEIAKAQFTKGMMSLLNLGGGGGFLGFLGNALSFDGGGYTGDGARTGGVDGKGGFWMIGHPRETVIDHTKRSSGGGGHTSVDVRAYVDDDGQWHAQVEKISDRSAARVGQQISKQLPGAVNHINTQSRRKR